MLVLLSLLLLWLMVVLLKALVEFEQEVEESFSNDHRHFHGQMHIRRVAEPLVAAADVWL